MTIWALKESGKISFIVQQQVQRACKQLQTQYSTNRAAKATSPTLKRNGQVANTKPDIHAYKLAQLRPIVAFTIVYLPVADNVDIVDMVPIVFFWVKCLVALWLLIVKSDDAILVIN